MDEMRCDKETSVHGPDRCIKRGVSLILDTGPFLIIAAKWNFVMKVFQGIHFFSVMRKNCTLKIIMVSYHF